MRLTEKLRARGPIGWYSASCCILHRRGSFFFHRSAALSRYFTRIFAHVRWFIYARPGEALALPGPRGFRAFFPCFPVDFRKSVPLVRWIVGWNIFYPGKYWFVECVCDLNIFPAILKWIKLHFTNYLIKFDKKTTIAKRNIRFNLYKTNWRVI